MTRKQVNFRLPVTLIEALKVRAETERLTMTEVAISLMETGLGLLPSSDTQPRTAGIEERIAAQLEERIERHIEERIATQLEPIQGELAKVDERIHSAIQHIQASSPQVVHCESLAMAIADDISGAMAASPLVEDALDTATTHSELVENIKQLEEEIAVKLLEEETQRVDLHPLTSLGLAARLGVDNSSISRNKHKGNRHLREWSAKLDHGGIAWEFREGAPRSPQFHPLIHD